MSMFILYIIIPLLVGGAASLLLGINENGKSYSKYAAFAGSLGSSILALIVLLYPNMLKYGRIGWFTSVGGISFPLSFSFGYINQILLILIGIISPLIFLYSIGYMDEPGEQGRYYVELSIFAASMTLLAISGGFITFFIAWEGLGITSYLLIGFWMQKDAPPYAARKAITTILIGDIMMLSGILLIWASLGTFNFAAIISAIGALSSVPISIIIALGLIIFGAFTKSAQFPFHEWLSDAMEGPTPVSAFLHSSTMVKSGIFIVIILLPIIVQAKLLWVLLVFGIVTSIIGAFNASGSTHLKKILAYSTIEDLGLMFVALGLNAVSAAVALFIVQAIYKALLFMNAGSMMKANNDEVDIYQVSSFNKNRLLLTVGVIAAISLAGIFPASGFFGKLLIDNAASSNTTVYIILTVLDFVTGFYIFRWLFIPLNRGKNGSLAISAKYSALSKAMIIPQVILAAIVLLLTLFFLYTLTSINVQVAAILTSASLFGVLSAYLLFRVTPNNLWERSRAREFLSKGFFVNKGYSYVAFGIEKISIGIEALDGAINRMVYAGAEGVIRIGNSMRRTDNGIVNTYVAALAIGFVLLIAILVFSI